MAIDKLDASATAMDVQAILWKFVRSFNRLDLDTIMREEGDAFEEIVERRPDLVSKKQAAKWSDDWREF